MPTPTPTPTLTDAQAAAPASASAPAPASASASASAPAPAPASASAPAPAHPVPSGPPSANNACSPNEPAACAPGGFEELACTGGVWKLAQVCRGPGHCKADGAGVHCDVGAPIAGDACPATVAPRCAGVHTVFSCKAGVWESSMCVPPGKCVPNAKNGVAGCK